MDRRTILAVVLALTTFLLWDAWMNYRYPDRYAELATTEVVESETPAPTVPTVPVAPASAPAPVAAASPEVPVVPEREVPFAGCDVTATWATSGGWLRDAVLTEHRAPYVVQPVWT